MLWTWLQEWWSAGTRGPQAIARLRRGSTHAVAAPAMIEYLETRQLFSGNAVNPTESAVDVGVIQLNESAGTWEASRFNGTDFIAETVTTWKAVPEETVVVHGDLWGTGQDEMIRYDRATGSFMAEWKSGSGIATGVVATWVPNMDLQFLTIQDLNHDGRDDIIAQDRTTGKWAMSTSTGAGGYNSRFIGTWQVGVDWQHVTIADVNGDQIDDVFAINPANDSWYFLVGSSGTFTSMTVGNAFATDRIDHLVVGNYDANPGVDVLQRETTTGVWLKSSMIGSGFYSQAAGMWSPETTWSDVVTLDFWGTGRDAVIGRDAANGWQIIWAAGSGSASSNLGAWAAGDYVDANVGDFNGDGREDLVARRVDTGRWYLLAASATSVESIPLGAWTPSAAYDAVFADDFNNDGKTDLVGQQTGTNLWQGMISTASSTFATMSLSNPEVGYLGRNQMVGDFDADGALDVMSHDFQTGNRQLVEVQESQLIATRFNEWFAYSNGWNEHFIIDFNGDGDNDILARDATTGTWWLTTFSANMPTTSKVGNWDSSVSWQTLKTLDFDGNGTTDVLARNPNTGDWYLLRMVNGKPVSSVIANWSTAVSWVDFQVVDLFGTGRPMLLARDAATNQWRGLWSAGNGFSTGALRGMVAGQNYVDTRVVEFFADGRQAVVTRDALTGTWYALWYGTNQFHLTNLDTWDPNTTWDSVVAADLNGTGQQALYGHNAETGQWLRIQFDGITASNVLVGQTPANTPLELASVGNFITTSRDTILARSTTTGKWYRLSSNGSPASTQLQDLGLWAETATWTTTTVGDYNRDGRADLFGYSTNLTSWRIRSFDGTNWFGVAAGNLSPNASVKDVPGASDATIRALIMGDLPGLNAALMAGDTRTAVTMLRRWAANAADAALFSNPLLTDAMGPAQAYFSSYLPNKAGSTCGGYAEFYTQLMTLFGIDSLTVNFGDYAADLIHTSVVVPIWENNAWSFELFDPTFNISIIDTSSGQLVSYLDVVGDVQAGNTAHLSVEQSSNANREFLSTLPSSNPALTFVGLQDGVYVYRWVDYGLDDYIETYKNNFSAYGYSPGLTGFYELMTKVISVYAINGSGNPQTSADMKAAFLSGLQELGINVAP